MTDANLDRAAQMAGYDGWRHVEEACGAWTRDVIESLADTLDELDAAKAELEAFKREVSDAIVQYCGGPKYVPTEPLARFILPEPDPLVEVCREIGLAPYRPEQIRAAIKKRGGKIVWGEE